MSRLVRLIIAAYVLSLLPLATARAAAPSVASKSGSIDVSPAVAQITLANGQTSASFNTELTNNDNAPIVVQVQMNDFTALNNTGSVSFLSKNYPGNSLHGLADWMHADSQYVSLPAHASQTVPITIPNTSGLAPGGHYGAVIFRVIPTTPGGSGGQLQANEEVSVLVFLTTYNGRVQAITLHKPQFNSIFTAMPGTVDLVFSNSGNTQTTPHGLVTIVNSKNKEVARGVINVDSGLVLPATSRLYEVNMVYAKRVSLPGTYHIDISYRPADGQPAMTYTKSFTYINRPIIIAILLLALAGILLFFRKMSREYTRYKTQT